MAAADDLLDKVATVLRPLRAGRTKFSFLSVFGAFGAGGCGTGDVVDFLLMLMDYWSKLWQY